LRSTISFILILIFSFNVLYGDNSTLDSLENLLPQSSDSSKIRLLNQLSFNYWRISATKAKYYSKEAISLAISLNDSNQLAEAHNNLGRSYYQIGEHNKALEEYFKALEINETLHDSIGISSTSNNIGLVYWNLKEFEEAVKFYRNSLQISEFLKDSNNIASALNNIGIISVENNEFDAGLENFIESLNILIQINDKTRISTAYNNIGFVYELKEQYNEAVKNYQHSLDVAFSQNASFDIAQACNNIGSVYLKINNLENALEFLSIGKENALKINAKTLLEENYLLSSKVYDAIGNKDMALKSFQQYSSIKDSLMDESKSRQITEMQTKYNTERKEKEIILKNLELEKNKNKIKIQGIVIISITGFAIMIVVLFLIVIRQNRIKQKMNSMLKKQNFDILKKTAEIELQKKKIEQQKEEITTQRDLALYQNKEISEQKEEIIDSILYAEKIQRAVFPQEEELKLFFRNYFILNKPRDIVSGDFYWIGPYENKILLAVADCTGHGVPGAFMSLLGIAFLNKIILEKGISTPSLILNNLRQNIIETLHHKGTDRGRSDGMDITLIAFDQKMKNIEVAAANNPLIIIRDNKIIEISPDKMPIGVYEELDVPFTNKESILKKDDVLYLFTDGYADQFGGKSNKKLLIKNFKNILLEIHKYDMDHQKVLLESKFKEWKGDTYQIDDILIIGMKI
jgi:serine phosphatase RsbU (regulator of sigma subunit)/Tfp pilus assembly protein PilF